MSPSVVSKYKKYHPFVMTTGYPAPSRSSWEFLEIFERLLVVTSHVMLFHVAPRYNPGHFSRLLSPQHGWPQSTDIATGLAPQGDLELHTWAHQKETTVQKRQIYSCDLKGHHYCRPKEPLISADIARHVCRNSLPFVNNWELVVCMLLCEEIN